MALDINNPLGFIASIVSGQRAQKWYRCLIGCSVAAFIGFWGGGGLSAGFLLAAYPEKITYALASGFISGAVLMAAAVLWTIKRQKMWDELGIALPKQLEEIIEQTDIGGTAKK